MKHRLNDFFCGCGGIGAGFLRAGFEIVGAWDFDKYAVETYRANIWPGVKQMDIKTMSISDIPKAEVWSFGFPCQDLSVAGLQAGMEVTCSICGRSWKLNTENKVCPDCGSERFTAKNRSSLFFEIMRLLDEAYTTDPDKLPRILMAENVKALRPYLPILEEQYERRGYKATYTLFNSKYWGVPQNRERYFVIGVRKDIKQGFVFPREQHDFVPRLSSVLEENVEEKYYISDEKARTIINQALNKINGPGGCHAVMTPDRGSKKQNGRRAKDNEEPMFTLTAQDQHGVMQRQLIPDGDSAASALIHSRGMETRKDGVSRCLKGGTGGSSKNFLIEKTEPPGVPIAVKLQNANMRGRRFKEPEEESFSLTSGDIDGVIVENGLQGGAADNTRRP